MRQHTQSRQNNQNALLFRNKVIKDTTVLPHSQQLEDHGSVVSKVGTIFNDPDHQGVLNTSRDGIPNSSSQDMT